MTFIAVDGLDRVGKSSLIKALHELTNYKYQIVDRFTGSTYAYGKLRDRDIDYEAIFENEKALMSIGKVFVVIVSADTDVIVKRMKATDEKDIEIADIDKLKELYSEYSLLTPLNVIRIDTTNDSPTECAEKVLSMINSHSISLTDIISRAKKHVEIFGKKVRNTREVLNYHVNFESSLEPLSYMIESFIRDLNDIYPKLLLTEIYAKQDSEEYFYRRIKESLIHEMKKALFEQKDSEFSRRFSFSSNECIQSLHLIFRDETAFCNVYIRSSNVKDILPFDVIAICQIAAKATSFVENLKIRNFKFDIHIGSMHLYE